MTFNSDRHSRHVLFAGIGEGGQKLIEASRVTIVGCGALGSRSAELLGRAGVSRNGGRLTLIDRDYVDESNLQRQALFTEDDATRSVPKAEAARRHLLQIDSALTIEAHVRDLNAANAQRLLAESDLIIDGTDNFQTRFIVNDAALSLDLPWIYGGAVGSHGTVAFIRPPSTPCFRCYLEFLPPAGVADTCDTAGIITPLPSLVAGYQVAMALRFLVDGSFPRGLSTFDAWALPGEARLAFRESAALADCPSCGLRSYPALNEAESSLVTLCGRNSVQITSGVDGDLGAAAARLEKVAVTTRHAESVTASIPEGKITLFRDGRIVVEGTTDPHEAKSIAARYLA
jgi:adenylyltransferase/sulfurtransferase